MRGKLMPRCARCGGSMAKGNDSDGAFSHCLMCGAYVEETVQQRPAHSLGAALLLAEGQEAARERQRKYMREYNQRPERKAKRRSGASTRRRRSTPWKQMTR